MARRGVQSCTLALAILAIIPNIVNNKSLAVMLLRIASVCLAFTSATVVNSLTAYASLQCDDVSFDQDTGKPTTEHPELAKGRALGEFRSSGQLGRAAGPLLGAYPSHVIIYQLNKLLQSMRVVLDYRAFRHLCIGWLSDGCILNLNGFFIECEK